MSAAPAVHLVTGTENVTRCGRNRDSVTGKSTNIDNVTCKKCLGLATTDRELIAQRDAAKAATLEPEVTEPRKVRPPMNRAEKRAARRNLKARGIDPDVMFVRYDLSDEQIKAATERVSDDPEAHWSDLVMIHLQAGIVELEREGAAVRDLTVITIGKHPRNPGGLSIEIKSKP